MTKMNYVNMGVQISVSTSTMQAPARNLSEVNFNILNIKLKNVPISFELSEMSFVFPIWFGPDENQHQIK